MWRWIKNVAAFIFLLLCFVGYRLYFFTNSGINQFITYSTAQHVIIIYLIYQIVKIIPYENINKKVTWLYILIFYAPAALGFYLYVKWKTVHGISDIEYVLNWGQSFIEKSAAYRDSPISFICETLYIPVFYLLSLWGIDRLTRNINLKSDNLNDQDIFLFIIKPKNFRGLFMTAVKQMPLSGVFVYANGYIYCFRVNSKFVQRIKIPKDLNLKRYIILNTGKKINDYGVALSNLPGTQRRRLKTCLSIFTKPFDINLVKLVKEKR